MCVCMCKIFKAAKEAAKMAEKDEDNEDDWADGTDEEHDELWNISRICTPVACLLLYARCTNAPWLDL